MLVVEQNCLLVKFWFRRKQIPVSGKVNHSFMQKRKSETPNAVAQDIPHNPTIMSDVD